MPAHHSIGGQECTLTCEDNIVQFVQEELVTGGLGACESYKELPSQDKCHFKLERVDPIFVGGQLAINRGSTVG